MGSTPAAPAQTLLCALSIFTPQHTLGRHPRRRSGRAWQSITPPRSRHLPHIHSDRRSTPLGSSAPDRPHLSVDHHPAALESPICSPPQAAAQTTTLSLPLYPSSTALPSVPANYLGLSIELSSLSSLLGPGVPPPPTPGNASIPTPFLTYLQNVYTRLGAPLRLRIGGNSMDSSVYAENQTTTLLEVLDPAANSNNVPVSFGPLLFSTLGALITPHLNLSYTFALPLLTPNDTASYAPLAAAEGALLPAGTLDLVLLGNEPDLYYDHGDRPGFANYSVDDYIGDFGEEIAGMTGDLQYPILGGPTICCNWDLSSLAASGYLTTFSSQLKAITLQHYPQNNCFGSYAFGLDYYLLHSNVVGLAQWQAPGVGLARAAGKEVRMTEFNTASCGGVPGISDTFAATLWTIDYALQLATQGFTGAHIHTREPGVSYNIFSPPNTTAVSTDSSSASAVTQALESGWTTGVTYWPLLVVAEALGGNQSSANATRSAGVFTAPVDLNLSSDATAGYALYSSAGGWQLSALLLINYGASNLSYALPPGLAPSGSLELQTKLLLAPDTSTTSPPITWAGQAISAAGDGALTGAHVSVIQVCPPQTQASGACVVSVPGPGVALVSVTVTVGEAGGEAAGTGTGTGAGGGKSTVTVQAGQSSTPAGAGAGPTGGSTSGARGTSWGGRAALVGALLAAGVALGG
ncbi:glycoside hydrolase family 79 protein [Calocera cornea HHB12733]|uniref:Glycoside hydrolase family 79 protein n=1 Tax=Calocera cornea HHB12733 TaxID=1353952 RepID=A0A165CYV5_9BASI|nr:glycoside hydrolase family 79 protein [Calocera cornea HHB12733]